MKKEEPKVLRRMVIPVTIAESSNITAALNFHKPHQSPILPASISTNFKKVKMVFKNDADKMEDLKRFREVKSYEITVNSDQFPHSKFTTDIPFDAKVK